MAKQFFPLSKSEEGIYISSLNGGDAYNLAHVVNLGSSFSKEEVSKALNKVCQAHPYIFTELSSDDEGRIVKSINAKEIELQCEEVDSLNIESKPYELLNSPLYRFKLYKVKDELIFYFDFFHLIMDGLSIKIFIDDFFSALEGKELIKEESDANQYSLNEEKNLNSPKYNEGKAYYDKLVGGIETDSFMTSTIKLLKMEASMIVTLITN